MKPERAFIAERAAAVHCVELLGKPAPAPGDLLPALSALGERFAKALAPMLARFVGGEAPTLKHRAARTGDLMEFGSEIGVLAANSLFAVGADDHPVAISLHAGALLGMVDRTFGGRGLAPDPLPARLPLSAELMVARLESLTSACLAEALGLADSDAGAEAVRFARRDGAFPLLEGFAPGAPLAALRIDVSEPGREAWPIFIVMTAAALAPLLGENALAPPRRVRGRADPATEPFASLPLSLSAVLVDMAMPISALADLAPGMILPVSVARNVPIKLGGKVLASGSVGAADDRVAIRITHLTA